MNLPSNAHLNDQIDCLKQDTMISVVLVDTLGHFSAIDDLSQDFIQFGDIVGIGGRREILQEAQQFDLQPRTDGLIISVIWKRCSLKIELCK